MSRGKFKRFEREKAKERKTPGISRYERFAHLCPFVAEAPIDTIPLIAAAAEPSVCVQMVLADGKTRRWRFMTRGLRDRFVWAFRDRGARPA